MRGTKINFDFIMNKENIKNEIFERIKKFYKDQHYDDDYVRVAWPCYDHNEIINALDSLLNLRISQGQKVKNFETDFSSYVGTKHGIAVNSGSSANLLAINALIVSGRIKRGQEVIVPAATFTTVISPIIQNGLIPVFVDVDEDTYNIKPSAIEDAVSENTGLIMVVHSLGCPARMNDIIQISKKYNIPILEDCCEAHGATFNKKKVGSMSLISTYSFFIAHNITSGEGGMILTDEDELDEISRSLREFGRLIENNKIKERFYYSDEYLKEYDERYAFMNIGYNVRMSDIHAALGVEQLKKLDTFNEKRAKIAEKYSKELKKFTKFITLPHIPDKSFHSFYGYPIVIKENAPFSRHSLVNYLEKYQIETRAFMGGNLAKHPAYRNEKILIKDLKNTELIENNAFFIGCHPFINEKQVRHVIDTFNRFFMEYNIN